MSKMFFFVLLGFIASAVGQTPYSKQSIKPEKTYKFAEFVHAGEESWKSHLDAYAIVRKTYPDASLYLRVYVKAGEPRKSTDKLIKQYEEYFRRIDSGGVLTGTGGYRKQVTTELWVIGKDGLIPLPTPDEPFVAEKVDEVGDVTDSELDERLQKFWYQLIDEGESSGYIINYGTEKQIAKRERDIANTMVRKHLPRVTFVSGGNAEAVKTVLWLVPPTAENPPVNE